MVSRPIITAAVLLAAVIASTISVFVVRSGIHGTSGMIDEQRVAREKFFGANKELPSIEKGQEMRPRW